PCPCWWFSSSASATSSAASASRGLKASLAWLEADVPCVLACLLARPEGRLSTRWLVVFRAGPRQPRFVFTIQKGPGMLSPRARVERALRGGHGDCVPFTIYESKIPQCVREREMRNRGLCI